MYIKYTIFSVEIKENFVHNFVTIKKTRLPPRETRRNCLLSENTYRKNLRMPIGVS